MTNPTPSEAGALLAKAESTSRQVRTGSGARTGAWLVGMAVATFSYLTSMGIAGTSDSRVVLASTVFGVVVAALSLGLLPGVRVNRAGFGRRWVAAVATWGLLYATGLIAGVYLMRDVLVYWPLAGALVALPLALGARAEARP